MEATRASQGCPDVGRRPRREADDADDASEKESPAAAPADLYDVLGYRASGSSVTTQQWLSMRCLSF
jgi:hypothetical protein